MYPRLAPSGAIGFGWVDIRAWPRQARSDLDVSISAPGRVTPRTMEETHTMSNVLNTSRFHATIALAAIVAALGCSSGKADIPPASQQASTQGLATHAAATLAPGTPGTPVVVYKDAQCGCCKAWVQHMRDNGFQVTAIDEPARVLDSIKTAHGINDATASCHTAEVGKYVIEGHVPADLVQKLLTDKPADVVGLTVPGMVTGTPGMEGGTPEHYTVLAMMRDGTTRPYAQR